MYNNNSNKIVVAEALRMCNFEFGPDYIPLELYYRRR